MSKLDDAPLSVLATTVSHAKRTTATLNHAEQKAKGRPICDKITSQDTAAASKSNQELFAEPASKANCRHRFDNERQHHHSITQVKHKHTAKGRDLQHQHPIPSQHIDANQASQNDLMPKKR